jgi:hypothetical protein
MSSFGAFRKFFGFRYKPLDPDFQSEQLSFVKYITQHMPKSLLGWLFMEVDPAFEVEFYRVLGAQEQVLEDCFIQVSRTPSIGTISRRCFLQSSPFERETVSDKPLSE